MNDKQKVKIQELRLQGAGYRKIAKEMGLSENTIKSYCRRHPLIEQKEIWNMSITVCNAIRSSIKTEKEGKEILF